MYWSIQTWRCTDSKVSRLLPPSRDIVHGVATFDHVIEIASDWPEVTISTSYSTPALKVRNKSFCRLWGERDRHKSDLQEDDVLVVFCEIDEKEFLLAESDGSIFTSAHYDGYGAVLVRLELVLPELLAQLLWDSYLLRAPSSIVKRYGEASPP